MAETTDGVEAEVALRSVRALRSCVLADERTGRIGADYRKVLLELRADVDRILSAAGRALCGRCEGELGAGEVGWHAICPGAGR
jgi:hypothetical protein